MDKVSIIIPVYNVENEVANCLESVINQTHKNLEIIVVNDGSTDGSKEICLNIAKKDNRIIYLEKPNGGLSDARNFGLEIASGDYLFFLDSDDTIDNDCIKTLYSLIEENQSDIAVGQFNIVYDTGKVETGEDGTTLLLNNEQALECALYDEFSISACAKLFKRELFKKIRFPVGRLYEDVATTYKALFNAEKISYIGKGVYNYLIRQGSITRKEFNEKKLDVITSSDEMCDFCSQTFPSIEKATIRRRVWARLNVLTQIAVSKKGYKPIKPIISFVKKHGKIVLKDKRAPKRDKLAIRCLSVGFWFFKLVWKTYQKIGKKY